MKDEGRGKRGRKDGKKGNGGGRDDDDDDNL
jgi:hypothetical protein